VATHSIKFRRNLSPPPGFKNQTKPEHGFASQNQQTIMKTTTLMTLGAMIGTCLIASAQDGPKRPPRHQGPPPPEILEKFDKDGDGKLSPEERKAMPRPPGGPKGPKGPGGKKGPGPGPGGPRPDGPPPE
jgi:hypothetical protein